MTDLVGRVRALDADATPKPWEWKRDETYDQGLRLHGPDRHFPDKRHREGVHTEPTIILAGQGGYDFDDVSVEDTDARLIAEFRSLAPALADRVEELEAENARLRAVLDEETE